MPKRCFHATSRLDLRFRFAVFSSWNCRSCHSGVIFGARTSDLFVSRQSGCQESQRKWMRKPLLFCIHIVQMVEKNNTCFRNPAIYRSSWQVGKSPYRGFHKRTASHNPNFWHLLTFHFMERQSRGKVLQAPVTLGAGENWEFFYWKNKHLLVPLPKSTSFCWEILEVWGTMSISVSFFLQANLARLQVSE